MVNNLADLAKVITSLKGDCKIIVIGGGVAVGKTTLAKKVADILIGLGHSVQCCSTDNFLYSNEHLKYLGLDHKKGWPESYDWREMLNFIKKFSAGLDEVYSMPYYCQLAYDVLPNNYLHLHKTEYLILEGVVALNEKLKPYIDFGIYLDSAEEDAKTWFVERCNFLIKSSIGKPENFYHKWSSWDKENVLPILEKCWNDINLKNLYENILPSKCNADLILSKNSDHSIAAFRNLEC